MRSRAWPRGQARCSLHLGIRHRLVVLPLGRLGRRGEDRLLEARAVDETLREADAAHVAVRGILPQSPSGQVGASHTLDGQHLQPSNEDRPTSNLRRHVGRQHVVGHDLGELLEPPQRELGEDRPFVGDRGLEDEVEGRDPVRGDEEQLVLTCPAPAVQRRVEVAHLAGVEVHETGDRQGLGRHGHSLSAARSSRRRQSASTGPVDCQLVLVVVDRTGGQRQAATTDARGHLVAHLGQRLDLRGESIVPTAGDLGPVPLRRWTVHRQRRERSADLGKWQPEALAGPDHGDPAQDMALEAALVARRAHRVRSGLRPHRSAPSAHSHRCVGPPRRSTGDPSCAPAHPKSSSKLEFDLK